MANNHDFKVKNSLGVGGVTSSTPLTSGSMHKIKLGQQYWNTTKGTDGSIKLELYSTGAGDTYGLGVSNSELEIQSQSDIGFYAGGDSTRTKRVHIEGSNGNVGIGTTSPNTALEIKRTSGTANLRLHADHTSTPRTAIEFMRGTTDTFGGDAYTDWKIGHVGSDQADFAIISHDTTRGANERLTIEYTTGNVGIGTTSPTQKLHVQGGQVRVSNGSDFYINSTSSNSYVYTSSTPFDIYTAGTNRMRVGSTGDVSIGNNAAFTVGGSAKLTVLGASGTVYLAGGSASGDQFYLRKNASVTGMYEWQTYYSSNNAGTIQLQPYGGRVTIGASNATNTSRELKVHGSFEATTNVVTPILYDSNDTAYYVDPAGTTNIANLDVNPTATSATVSFGSATQTGYIDLVLYSNSGNAQIWKSGTGYSGYGGTSALNIYNSNANIDLFSDGRTSYDLRASAGNVYAGVSSRAPIFYDSANSSYYVDPAGASILQGLKLDDSVNNASGTDAVLWIYRDNNNDWGAVIDADNGSATDYGLRIDVASSNSYAFRIMGGGSEQFRVGSDFAYHFSDMRSPIFYDSANTAYFLDPASSATSLSVLGSVLVGENAGYSFTRESEEWGGMSSGLVRKAYDTSNTTHAISKFTLTDYIRQATTATLQNFSVVSTVDGTTLSSDTYYQEFVGYYWAPTSGTYGFSVDGDDSVDVLVDGKLVGYWYGGHGVSNSYTGGSTGSNGGTVQTYGTIYLVRGFHRIKVRHQEGSGGDEVTLWHQEPSGSWEIVTSDHLYHNGSDLIHATGSGTSLMSSTLTAPTLRVGDGTDGRFFSDTAGRTAFADGDFYLQSSVGNFYAYATNTYLGASSGDNIYVRGNTISGNSWSITGAGVATFGTDARAPIFYDSNDTARYIDPNGDSYAGDYYNMDGWFRNYGQRGLYNQDTNSHFFSAGTQYWHISGGNTTSGGLIFYQYYNGTQGNATNRKGYIYWDSSGFGLLSNDGSWAVQTDNSKTQIHHRLDTPIIYDQDNTGYYADPNSLSLFHRHQTAYIGINATPNSSGAYRLNMGGHIHMNNYEINYVSQLHFNDNVRFYDDGNDNYLNFKWADTGSGGIKFLDGNSLIHGYVYGDGVGGFGLLDRDGQWMIYSDGVTQTQLRANNNVELYVYTDHVYAPGSFRAPVFYDSDNTSYFVNAGGTSSFVTVTADQFNARDMGDFITFYGDDSSHHAIASRDHAGNSADDLRINSYGSVFINLDSNNNNTSGADFKVGRHGAATGAIVDLDLFEVLGDSLYVHTDFSFRAPVFYDSNNTSYYLNPNSTSVVNNLTVNGTLTASIDAGATGGGSDKIFWENDQTVTTNYTITNGQNAMSAGPITINSGVTVTIGTGEAWTVV